MTYSSAAVTARLWAYAAVMVMAIARRRRCRFSRLGDTLNYTGVNRITYWSQGVASLPINVSLSYPPLDNIRVMV